MTKKKIFFVLAIFIILLTSLFIEKDIINKILYPKKYSDYVEIYSKEFGLDENLVYSVIKVESKFRKDAISHKGAKGLMQISDITREWAKEEMNLGDIDIFDPEINIELGTRYISTLIERYTNIGVALAAYNAGMTSVDKWLREGTISADGSDIENIPFKETNNYVRKILRDYEVYKEL